MVKLTQSWRLIDGTPIESCSDPLEIEIGAGNLSKGLESALVEMRAGEEKLIAIDPEEGNCTDDTELVSVPPLRLQG